MSADGILESDSLIAREKTLVGGRVWDGVPDDAILERDPATGTVLPYIVIKFGSLIPSFSDRSLMGEEDQPQIWSATIEHWAFTAKVARDAAGATTNLLLGWKPGGANSSQIRLRGGGDYRQTDSAGKPTRFMRAVNVEADINQSTTEHTDINA